jgi:hypothetical protein
MPPWLEDRENVRFAQGVNMRGAYVILTLAAQNINGENLDGVFGLRHEVSV